MRRRDLCDWAVFLVALGTAFCSPMARAQDAASEPNHVVVPQCRSYGFSRTGDFAVAVVGVQAFIQMSQEMTAETTLLFKLQNRSSVEQSAELLMPAPGDVTMELLQAGTTTPLPGRMLSEDEATTLCGQIVVDVNDPALMELVNTTLFRSDRFVLVPNAAATITASYRQSLALQRNRVDYLLPRTEFIGYQVPWEITVTVDASGPLSTLYSPSHKLDTHSEGDHRAVVTAVAEASTMAGPFRLYYLLEASQGFTSAALIYPSTRFDGGYFMFLAGLPTNVPDDGNDIKRELTLVLDRSGSMSGVKIEQVKQAARDVIAGLAEGEAFNLITYNDTIKTFNSEPLLKNASTMQAAFAYLDSISATGLTNLYGALETALMQKPTEGFLPLILFLTDGLPTTGERSEVKIRDLVLSSNPYNRRVYTLGVGYDLNAPLLDGLAEYSLARSIFVTPEDDVQVAIRDVFSSISHPLFADLEIWSVSAEGEAGTRRTYNVLPFIIPDLFQRDQMVLIGQYVGQSPFLFEIRGNYRNAVQSFFCPVDQALGSRTQGFVPRLWAGRVVAQIINEIRQLGADPGLSSENERLWDLSAAMVDLSLRWGILTEYTSFFGNGTVDLVNYSDLLYFGWVDLYNRAVRSREGMPAVNQSVNLNILKYQSVLNRDSFYLDRNMNEVRTTTIQHMNDLALYYYWGTWLDSELLLPPSDPNAEVETVEVQFGSAEFMELARRLASNGQQGCLGMPDDVALWESDKLTIVHMPEPVRTPDWSDTGEPSQTTTPRRR
ncbi:MAG: VWA domain-containing protein [Phycisphaerales bacterium]